MILKIIGLLIMVGVLVMWGFLMWRMIKSDKFLRRFYIGLFLFTLFFIFFFLFVTLSHAAENPAPPAPAENTAVVEKLVASCPTEFNIDDSAWAMSRIDAFVPQKISDDLAVAEHVRFFSYFPDPEQRIFVGIKKLWNPDCVANLYSYGSIGDADGKRVLGVIKASGKITVFLLTEKDWESGDDWETFVTNCSRMGCDLTFVLYRNKEQVVTRTMFINQYHPFSFEEPVE